MALQPMGGKLQLIVCIKVRKLERFLFRSRRAKRKHGYPQTNRRARAAKTSRPSFPRAIRLAVKLTEAGLSFANGRRSTTQQSGDAGGLGYRLVRHGYIPMPWSCISASAVGSSHLVTGTECQDSLLCEEIPSGGGGSVLLALVSDGAGSAIRSAVGSRLACETLRENVAQFFAEGGTLEQLNKQLIASWIELFRSEIALQAEGDGLPFREYSCTLVGVIAGEAAAAVFQIGDGAIVYSTAGDPAFKLAFWPERGEYENTTFFATQADFVNELQFQMIFAAVERLAVFSDGLQDSRYGTTRSSHINRSSRVSFLRYPPRNLQICHG